MARLEFINKCDIDQLCKLVTEERDFGTGDEAKEKYRGFMTGPVKQRWSDVSTCAVRPEKRDDFEIKGFYDGMQSLAKDKKVSKSSLAQLCADKAAVDDSSVEIGKTARRQDYEQGLYAMQGIIKYSRDNQYLDPDNPEYGDRINRLNSFVKNLRDEFGDWHNGVKGFLKELDNLTSGRRVLFDDILTVESKVSVEKVEPYLLTERLGFGVGYDFLQDNLKLLSEVTFAGAYLFNGKVTAELAFLGLSGENMITTVAVGGYGTFAPLSILEPFRPYGVGAIDFAASIGGAFASTDRPEFDVGAKFLLKAAIGARIASFNTESGTFGVVYDFFDYASMYGGGDSTHTFGNTLWFKYSGLQYDDIHDAPNRVALHSVLAGDTVGAQLNSYTKPFQASLSDDERNRARVDGNIGFFAGNVGVDGNTNATVMTTAGADFDLVPGHVPPLFTDVGVGPIVGQEKGIAAKLDVGARLVDIGGFEGSIVLSTAASATAAHSGIDTNFGARFGLDLDEVSDLDIDISMEHHTTADDDFFRYTPYLINETEYLSGILVSKTLLGLDIRNEGDGMQLAGVTGAIAGGFHTFGFIAKMQEIDLKVVALFVVASLGADTEGNPTTSLSVDAKLVEWNPLPDDPDLPRFKIGVGYLFDIYDFRESADSYIIGNPIEGSKQGERQFRSGASFTLGVEF